jgi:3-methyladenine DNA glycosylase AlkD
MTKLHPLTKTVRTLYAESANPEDAIQMQKYMKSEMLFHGVKSPIQKQINQQAIKQFPIKSAEEYELVLRELWDASYREERYTAITYAKKYKKYQVMEMLPLYRMMIESGGWWDYVDAVAAHLIGNLLMKYPTVMKPEMYRWIEDDNLWIRRTAILSQLRFKADVDREMLFTFCQKCLHEETFWIRKAIGWALRDFSKVYPDSVRQFVEKHRDEMSRVSLKEAEKYI